MNTPNMGMKSDRQKLLLLPSAYPLRSGWALSSCGKKTPTPDQSSRPTRNQIFYQKIEKLTTLINKLS
jgi:hypothetical protein